MLDTLAPPGLAVGVSDRAFGNLSPGRGDEPSVVLTRREALAELLGFALEDIVCPEQVHGATVARVGARDRGRRAPAADGLIADEPGLLLLMLFADCVPVCLFEVERRAVGIAHAGWKGTAGRIAAGTVGAMVEAFGVRPERLRAVIGPAIGACCYEVGDDVAAAVRASVGPTEADAVVRPGRRGRPHVDLAAANRAQLVEAGLRPESVEMTGLCTACRVDRFFSHRAEAGQTGRFGAAIGIVP
jgi:YfiH family protein